MRTCVHVYTYVGGVFRSDTDDYTRVGHKSDRLIGSTDCLDMGSWDEPLVRRPVRVQLLLVCNRHLFQDFELTIHWMPLKTKAKLQQKSIVSENTGKLWFYYFLPSSFPSGKENGKSNETTTCPALQTDAAPQTTQSWSALTDTHTPSWPSPTFQKFPYAWPCNNFILSARAWPSGRRRRRSMRKHVFWHRRRAALFSPGQFVRSWQHWPLLYCRPLFFRHRNFIPLLYTVDWSRIIHSEVGDRYLGSVFRYSGTTGSENFYRLLKYRPF